MTRRIAIYTDRFDPPTFRQRRFAEALSERFDAIEIVPAAYGPPTDATAEVESIHRAALTDINFRLLDRVTVDLSELESGEPSDLAQRAISTSAGDEVWLAVRAESFEPDSSGTTPFSKWFDSARLWREARFVVLHSNEHVAKPAKLPPRHELLTVEAVPPPKPADQRIAGGDLAPDVADYITRHGLYRGVRPTRRSRLRVSGSRLMIVADTRNPEAVEIAGRFANSTDDPELIVVIGGDGTMLRAIREHWRRRVPFYGINAGHIGFLLNEAPEAELSDEEFLLEHVPLLHVETEQPGGVRQVSLAFNDAWVERATGQTAWVEVLVNGQTRIPRLVADGALISTAAGSTSYARAMGATPLPLATSALLLVGSNVLSPDGWRPVVLPLESTIELRSVAPEKRPLTAYVDGLSHGQVSWMRARMSNIAAAELAFSPGHDPVAKLSKIQFPAR